MKTLSVMKTDKLIQQGCLSMYESGCNEVNHEGCCAGLTCTDDECL